MIERALTAPRLRICLSGLVSAIGCAGLLAVPLVMLVVWPHTYSPFASGKAEIFRWLCMVWCSCLLVTLAARPRAAPLVVWLFGAFVAVTALADYHAASSAIAFWGEPMRMDGFISIASYLCFFIALTLLPKGKRFWEWLTLGWGMSGVIVSFASLIQSYWFYFIVYYPVPRAYGLMGSPVFFGHYLALTILFTLWTVNKYKTWLFALVPQVPVLLMTGSRSAMAGLVVGIICLIPGKLKWIALIFGLALAIQVGASWHMATFADLAYRAGCWQGELSAALRQPWLGYGQENLHVVCFPEVWDRSHNLLLQALTDGGILAMVALLAFLTSAWKSVSKQPFAMSIFASYLVMTMVEPDTMTTIIPVLSALGWASSKVK